MIMEREKTCVESIIKMYEKDIDETKIKIVQLKDLMHNKSNSIAFENILLMRMSGLTNSLESLKNELGVIRNL